MAAVDAYPLQWPVERPRTRWRKDARFKASLSRAREGVLHELRLMGAAHIVINSDLRTRLDGLPYAQQRQPDDPAVAVYFMWKKMQHCMACDSWTRIEHNLHAIALHLSALRGQLRWGVGDVAAAFAGFRQLPGVGVKTPWWEMLKVDPSASKDQIRARFHDLIQQHHPDRGGNANQAAEITAAYNEAMEAP